MLVDSSCVSPIANNRIENYSSLSPVTFYYDYESVKKTAVNPEDLNNCLLA